MFRVLKSIVLSGSLAVAALLASASDANAQGWGISFGGGYPSQGYSNYGGYSGYGGGYGGNYGGGYGNYYQGYSPYATGYQTFYTPGSQFRGASPWGSSYRGGHHHHCH